MWGTSCWVAHGNTRGVVHDGRRNTHNFVHEGRRIVLFPSQPRAEQETLPQQIKSPSLLCSRSEFEKEFLDSGCAWLLVPASSTTQQSSPVPHGIAALLATFQDVFPSELPTGLPPLRYI